MYLKQLWIIVLAKMKMWNGYRQMDRRRTTDDQKKSLGLRWAKMFVAFSFLSVCFSSNNEEGQLPFIPSNDLKERVDFLLE